MSAFATLVARHRGWVLAAATLLGLVAAGAGMFGDGGRGRAGIDDFHIADFLGRFLGAAGGRLEEAVAERLDDQGDLDGVGLSRIHEHRGGNRRGDGATLNPFCRAAGGIPWHVVLPFIGICIHTDRNRSDVTTHVFR